MKTVIIEGIRNTIAISTVVFGLASCGPGYSNAQRDAATGAAIGGVAGGVIGHQSGNTAAGAAIGAGVGAAGGYAIGNEKDKRRGY